ncbi:MAG: hypothetical protein ABTQ27_14115 [Amaricoccus sp.]|uniref:hypothetical protein n=1 Tax=Amaricoccus sp. TaxID=1872485 RepID=UPI0033164925
MRRPCFFAAAGLLLGAGSASADACQTVLDAYTALSKAPAYRQTMSTPGEAPMELVTVGDTLYMKEGTGWTKLPLRPGMREQMMASIVPDVSALKDCSELGSETLGGIGTTIYSYQPPPMDGVPDTGPQKVWIGEDGLPRRMTVEQDGGTLEVVMSFDGVTAPIP